jgi:hypothetical protein
MVAKRVYQIAKIKDLAVWVPAFAGTTMPLILVR